MDTTTPKKRAASPNHEAKNKRSKSKVQERDASTEDDRSTTPGPALVHIITLAPYVFFKGVIDPLHKDLYKAGPNTVVAFPLRPNDNVKAKDWTELSIALDEYLGEDYGSLEHCGRMAFWPRSGENAKLFNPVTTVIWSKSNKIPFYVGSLKRFWPPHVEFEYRTTFWCWRATVSGIKDQEAFAKDVLNALPYESGLLVKDT